MADGLQAGGQQFVEFLRLAASGLGEVGPAAPAAAHDGASCFTSFPA